MLVQGGWEPTKSQNSKGYPNPNSPQKLSSCGSQQFRRRLPSLWLAMINYGCMDITIWLLHILVGYSYSYETMGLSVRTTDVRVIIGESHCRNIDDRYEEMQL